MPTGEIGNDSPGDSRYSACLTGGLDGPGGQSGTQVTNRGSRLFTKTASLENFCEFTSNHLYL